MSQFSKMLLAEQKFIEDLINCLIDVIEENSLRKRDLEIHKAIKIAWKDGMNV